MVADFNGNGHNDVIAASAGSYDLDYYNGTGLPIMAESSIPTQGKVSRIAVADFDGDLAADVLYSQLGDGRDSLYVAFGRAAGPPETPVKITEIDPVADLLVMGSLLLQAPVAVLSLPKKGGALVSILLNYERLLLAPSLFSVASTGDHLPLVLTAGPLTGAGRIDVAAVAIDLDALQLETPVQSLDLWAALGAGGPPGKPVRLSSGVVFDSDELPLSMAWADVDGDGHPEMALVSVKGVNLATGANDPKGGTLRLGRLAVASMAWTDLGRVDLDFTPTPDGKLAFADLDGDGRPDLVLANGEETQVLWNDGKGQFAGDAVSSIPGARSFAIYRDRSGGAPWVVFVTSDSVQKVQGVPRPASPAPPANALQPTAALYPLPGTESVLTNATGVAIGDVDGDGIDDLAVVDDQHLRILRGKAVLP